jgi:NAD+ synthase
MTSKTIIPASALLKIDEERAVAAVTKYLHNLCTQHSVAGVLAGLSGGIDSALLVTLAAQALGERSAHAIYLYDRDSEHDLGCNAQQVAEWLGIDLETESIEAGRGERGLYMSWGMRLTRLSPFLNRFIYRVYHIIAGETPFVSSLRAGRGELEGHGLRISVIRFVNQYAEEVFYARHRYRREVLESKVRAKNWLVLGAANRSEWETGWFVKDGVDDLPYQPLIGLYKTQVRQLASYLGMPVEIQQQVPSPDMMKGIRDEYALGMSYSTLDLALDYLAGGVSREQVRVAGVTEEDLRRVREMKELSSWKRRSMTEPLPVDGSRRGGLRLGS